MTSRQYRALIAMWLAILICVLLAAYSATAGETDTEFITLVRVKHTVNTNDVQFFELRNGDGAAVVSVGTKSDFSKFLLNHDGQTVVLTVGAR